MPKLSTKELSDLVARAASPRQRRYEIRDAKLRGFLLRVNPSGAKSWYVQLDRKHKRKIGDAAVLTASMARFRARDLLQRAAHLKSSQTGQHVPSLGHFLAERYSNWLDRRSRYGKRDTRRLVSALGSLADERIDHIGVSRIERWKMQRSREVSPATLNRELSALKAALNRAVRWKLISDNPVRRVKMKTGIRTKKPRTLDGKERLTLLETLLTREDMISTLVVTALNTGLSRGELFRLRWKDVFFGTNSFIEVTGTRNYHNKNRKIPLNSTAVSKLKSWKVNRRRRSTLVFPSPSGGRLKSVDTAWRSLMKEAGIRGFRLCDCRHDFAVRLIHSGVPVSRVSELLGHSNLGLTERYTEFVPGTAREAVDKLVPPAMNEIPVPDQNSDAPRAK